MTKTLLARAAFLLLPALLVAQAPDSTSLPSRATADSLYWQHRFSDARREYEAALAVNPEDTGLRLAYGQMLVETLQTKRAREILAPLVGCSNGQAELLLGTNAYWSGDYSDAQRFFVDALHADSTLAKARLQLYEIAAVTAPSFRFGVTAARDDQPLRTVNGSLGGEYFPLPNIRVWLRVGLTHLAPDDGRNVDLTGSEGGVSHYAARHRLDVDVREGLIATPAGRREYERTMALSVGKRLPNQLVARISLDRDRYLHTRASIDTVVMTWSARGGIALNPHRGWLGEASLQRHWFPDHNAVTSSHLWFLAPIAKSRVTELQAGYAAGYQNADEGRFALAFNEQQLPLEDPRSLNGRYSPYYTPDHLMTHSALLAATTRIGSNLTLRTSGSVGLYARDNAPAFERTVPAGEPVLTSYRRTFTPWSARAALDVARGRDWILALAGDYQHTSFYSSGTAGLQLTRRFTASAIRRADRY